MTKSLALFFVSALAVALAASSAQASFYATCELKVSVLEVTPAPASKLPSHLASGVKAKFKVTSVLAGAGHAPNYCQKFPSMKPFQATLATLHPKVAAQVIKGASLKVYYSHSNGLTPKGVVYSTTWSLDAPGTPPPVDPKTLTNPLVILNSCLKDSTSDQCSVGHGPMIIGASPDGKSLVHWDLKEVGGCGDGPFNVESKGLVISKVGKRGLKRSTRHTFDVPAEGDADEMGTRAKAWKAIAKIAKAGFTPLHSLVTSTVEKQAGIQSHSPIAILGGRLNGWQVALSYKAGRYSVVLKGAKKSHTLGKIKAPKVEQFDEESDDDKPKSKWVYAQFPSVEQVSVFNRGGQPMIVVAVSAHDGGHCASGVVRYLTAKLPGLR